MSSKMWIFIHLCTTCALHNCKHN